jgi:hypothetical protein
MSTTDERTASPDAAAQLPNRTKEVPRSRGALSGMLLIVLGAWGALIPFIGPYFNLSYTPDTAWHWTSARGWLEVLPGAVAFVGGVLLLMSASRGVIRVGAWLGVAAGVWFIIGRSVSRWWKIGSPGVPAGKSEAIHAVETLVMFTGLGALILFFAATALGRLSVTSVRDARVAQRRIAKADKRNRGDRESAYEQGRQDALAETQRNTTGTPMSNQPVSNQRASNQPVSDQPVSNEQASNQPVSNQPRPLGWHDTVSSPPPPPPAEERPTQP